MHDRTPEPPFPDACRTGRKFITPCCTSSLHEFVADGTLHLASRVAGHGWSAALERAGIDPDRLRSWLAGPFL